MHGGGCFLSTASLPEPGLGPDLPSGASLVISCASVPARVAAREAWVARLARISDMAGVVLLILAIMTLMFRPADLIPSLEGTPLYETLVVCCLAAGLPRVARQLSARALSGNAITSLSLLLIPAIALSQLMRGDTWSARMGTAEAVKAGLLFLLVVGLITTTARLRALLFAVAAGVGGVTLAALLNFYHIVHISALETVAQRSMEDPEATPVLRLCATGIFNDPNDYGLVLVQSLVVCGYALNWKGLGPRRWLVLLPMSLFGLALVLTHSRGGLMSGAAAATAFLAARLKWKNALPVVALLSLVLLAPFWGRQAQWNISNPEDTFQSRLDLWRSALDCFLSAPLFGIGQGRLVDEIGQVAHNSFLHAFAELGLLGGMAFIGAFALAARGVWRARPTDDSLARMRPYVVAIVVGYSAGILALSRCYTVPTQLLLAIATVHLRLSAECGGAVVPRVNRGTLQRCAAIGVLFLAGTYLFVRMMLLRGL